MAGTNKNRERLLRVYSILMDQTDENHPVNSNDIQKILYKEGIEVKNRKTIYTDIEMLRAFGEEKGFEISDYGRAYDQNTGKSGKGGWYVLGRRFELSELKILVDAVQYSKFTSKKLSEKIIGKLKKLTSEENAKDLQRELSANQVKPEQGSQNAVDHIFAAIRENKRVNFQYCEWNIEKKLVPRHNGKIYDVSPWKMIWSDDNYYMVAYDAEAGIFKTYRIDKIKQCRMTDENRLGRSEFREYEKTYKNSIFFGMYGGEPRQVMINCPITALNPLLDRFGSGLIVTPTAEGRFSIAPEVVISPQFFGWVAGLGPGVRIENPDVARDYEEYLKGLLAGQNVTQ